LAWASALSSQPSMLVSVLVKTGTLAVYIEILMNLGLLGMILRW
jgi:hypothetical protein